MSDFIIHNIFPTPIYTKKINRPFTKQELNFVKQQKKHCKVNTGNINTKDSYILKRKEFKNIKKFIDKSCKEYLQEIICPENKNLELYITQSWLNYTETKQYHHQHSHANSIISGVLYLDSDIKNDKIVFTDGKGYQQMSPKIDDAKFNLWNSKTWFFNVETGNLFLFPSSTIHQVDIKKGDNTRISLAFNTFYKGVVGSEDALTELIL
tara:strand:+ start:3184 stop:3810 length:627 start_codon:yes stop_codon:yes gene_type:complete